MSEPTEEWRPVMGYEGLYEVSNRGGARSLPRVGRSGRTYGGTVITPSIEKRSGYPFFGLCKDGEQRMGRVHNLVLEAFVGPRPAGHVARHLNGNPADNRVENLAWGTRLQNVRDSQIHGTWTHEEKHGMRRLTSLQAQAIYHLRGRMTAAAIAEAFGVSASTVQSIHNGVTWRVTTGRLLPKEHAR